MAAFSQQVSFKFVPGTTVAAYKASNWAASQLPPTGAPQGSAETSGVVAADGSLALSLTDSTEYFLTNTSGTPGSMGYVRFGSAARPADSSVTAAAALSGISTVDVCGHSIPVGVGVSLGDQDNYVDRFCRMLGGVVDRRNLSIGSAVGCWHAIGASYGTPGWGYFVGSQNVHGLYPRQVWGAPYYPLRDLGIIHFGLNDLAELGSTNPGPFQHAIRNLISAMLTTVGIQGGDAAWAFTGTWSTTANSGGLAAGPLQAANFKFSSVVGDKATLTLPASVPAGSTIAITINNDRTYNLTVGVKVNGVSQANVVVDGTAAAPNPANTQQNQICLRFPNRTAGDTIELSVISRTAGFLLVDEARVEASGADAPVVLVLGLHTPTSFTFWNSWFRGPSAGTDPMGVAGIPIYNAAIQSVISEFPSTVRFVNLDTIVGAHAPVANTPDGVHPDDVGHGLIAKKLYDDLTASGLVTRERQSRVTRANGFVGSNIIGTTFNPGLNSWAIPASPFLPLTYYKDLNGRVSMSGSVVSGSSATANIFQLPGGYRPGADRFAAGASSTGAAQVWKIAADGTISIVTGGDTVRSQLNDVSFMPLN